MACVLAAVGTAAFWLHALRSRPQPVIEPAATGSVEAPPKETGVAAAEPVTASPPEIHPAPETAPAKPPATKAKVPTAPVPAGPGLPTLTPKSTPAPAETELFVLYYGDSCPHCAKVEQYLNDNGIPARVHLTLKEIYHDRANADELAAKAQTCGIPIDRLGVPLLWTGQECLTGDGPIIDFFKSLAGS